MADSLMQRIGEWAREYITAKGRADFDTELLPEVHRLFGDEIQERWQAMSREAIRRFLKAQLSRDEHDDPNTVIQTKLPGFELPAMINVPREGGGITWIHTSQATRDDWSAQRQLLEANIVAAHRKRDLYDRNTDRLNTAWSVDATWTVGECIDYLASRP